MSLIVEDGTGKSDAESYVTTNEVYVYLEKFYSDSNYLTATEDEQETFCRKATQYLDMKYYGKWNGVKSHQFQALDFPRTDLYIDEWLFPYDEIPQKLKDACAEVVQIFVDDDDPLEAINDYGTVKKEKTTVAVITTEIEYAGGKSSYKKYPKVDNIVSALISGFGQVERG